MESESYKTVRLQQRVAELERTIGQKQLEVDFLNKLVELASEEMGYDLKKFQPQTSEWYRCKRNGHNYKMKEVYLLCNLSKQAHRRR